MMKRLLSLLLCAALAFGLCACGLIAPDSPGSSAQTPEEASASDDQTPAASQYIPGKISGRIYTSEWLGLQFTLPHGTEFGDQTVQDLYNLAQIEQNPNDYTVEDLYVDYSGEDAPSNTPVAIYATKLDSGSSLEDLVAKEKAYVLDLYSSFKSQYGLTVFSNWEEPVEVRFCGQTYLLQCYSTENYRSGWNYQNGIIYYDLFRVHDGHLIDVRFTVSDQHYLGSSMMTLQSFADMFTGPDGAKDTDLSAFTEPLRKTVIMFAFGGWLGYGPWQAQWTGDDGNVYNVTFTEGTGWDQIDLVLTRNGSEVIDRGSGTYTHTDTEVTFSITWENRGAQVHTYDFNHLSLTLTQTSPNGILGSQQKQGDVLQWEPMDGWDPMVFRDVN